MLTREDVALLCAAFQEDATGDKVRYVPAQVSDDDIDEWCRVCGRVHAEERQRRMAS